MKKRKYTKIQVLEPEIMPIQEAGKMHRETAEHFGGAHSGQKMFGETAKAGGRDTTEAPGASP